jgi:HAD superfamily hydrolase (TIGR01509 family)
MTETHPIRGVIFDMDGVLVSSEPFIAEAAIRMLEERYGVHAAPEDFRPFVGTGEARFIGGVAEKYGARIDLEPDKKRTYEIYLQIIKGRLQPVSGARAFVVACRRRGLKIAVATSSDRVKMEGNLNEIGLPPETFDVCVTGLDVARKKPDPAIFLLAAERLGLPAEECLVVEDAPNGIEAGKAAGARCLGLTTTFDEAALRAAGADWIAPDLAHVPPEALPIA